MKLVTIHDTSYLTGDELADAVVVYGVALAKRRERDVVDIPILTSEGVVNRAQLTIGSHLEPSVISDPESRDHLVELGTSVAMLEKAGALGSARMTAGQLDGH